MRAHLPTLLLVALALAGCQRGRSRDACTWTHPHAFVSNPDSGVPHERMPWVEVYRYERGGVLNKARVWGWTEAEAMRDAQRVAEALGRNVNPDNFDKEGCR